ncbi:MAG: helix-turn-helix transcriptional regulator [Hespellia sp.]|nr:helix-turn-helix transcriptional regulator [Hespellia sp.]
MKIYWNGTSKNIIGERVRELRIKQDISQRTLAARLTLSGIEFSDLTVLRIEQGSRFVPDYEVAAIADYFKISTDFLLGRAKE